MCPLEPLATNRRIIRVPIFRSEGPFQKVWKRRRCRPRSLRQNESKKWNKQYQCLNYVMAGNSSARIPPLTKRAAQFLRTLYAKRNRAGGVFGTLKLDYDYHDIRSLAANLIGKQNPFARHIISTPFPKAYNEYRKHAGRVPYVSVDKEIPWATAILSVFSTELQRFIDWRQQFERSFLLADYSGARAALNQCEEELGISTWLLEQRLLLEEYSSGFDANAELAAPTSAHENHWLVRYLGAFFSLRADKRTPLDEFDRKIARSLGFNEQSRYYSELQAYIAFKLNRSHESIEQHANYIISAESAAPIVDRYDTLVRMLVQLFGSKQLPTDHLRKYVDNLRQFVRDEFVDTMAAFLEGVPYSKKVKLDKEFLRVLDAYTVADYRQSADGAIKMIDEYPAYYPLYEIAAKSFAADGRRWKDGAEIKSVSDSVGANLIDAWSGGAGSENGRHELARIATLMPRTNLSHGLNWFCREEHEWRSSAGHINASIALTEIINPRAAWELAASGERATYLDQIFKSHSESMVVTFERDLLEAPETAKLDKRIPQPRQLWHRSRVLMSQQQWAKAAELLGRIIVNEVPRNLRALTENRIARAQFDCLFHLGKWIECAELTVAATIVNRASAKTLPIEKLVGVIERGDAPKLFESINYPLLYAFVSSKQKEIYPAYDGFMHAIGASKPTELFELPQRFGKQRLILFLSEVCVPKVLARSPIFESSEEVSNERIRICQFLAKSDSSDIAKYSAEINGLTQQLVIRRGVRQVESSKIFVDIGGLKRAGRSRWRHSYDRLVEVVESKTIAELAAIDLTQIIVIELPKGGKKRTEEEEGLLNVESIPLQVVTVSYAWFKQLFLDVRDQFVSSNEFGLNSYLSVRIRHGTIEGQVRSSFEAANLLSQKGSAGGTYLPNRYWDEKLEQADSERRGEFQRILQSFSSVIDGIATRLKGHLIRIRTEKKTEVGLFDYTFVDSELSPLFSQKFRAIRDYDQFIDAILDVLWARTHENLAGIRKHIAGPLKQEAYDALVTLQQQAKSVLPSAVNSDFQMVTSGCLTAFQNDFQRMSEWFNVSGQTTIEQFSLRELVQICASVISNTHLNSNFAPEVQAPDSPLFKGRYFPAFSDIVRTLMDNTISHSGVNSALHVTVAATVHKEVLTLTIANKLSEERRKTDPVEYLRKHYIEPTDKHGDDIVATEGGTGLRKIQKILRFDLARVDPRLAVEYQNEDYLAITLQFKTTGLTL
jgi:hypothetical protein